MSTDRQRSHSVLPFLLPLLGVAVLAFVAGIALTMLKVWPYPLARAAADAADALRHRYLEPDVAWRPASDRRSGAFTHDAEAVAPGVTFMALQMPDSFGARLIDRDGTVLHEWRASFDEIWQDGAPHILAWGDPVPVRWQGVHLFPNGDLLLNLQTEHFPYAAGLVKLDRNGKVLWKLARNTHHDVNVAEDGTIWVAALNYRAEGMPELPFFEPGFYEDVVLKVSPQGEVLEEISIPLALKGMRGLLGYRVAAKDPTHLNDVELVTPALADSFPNLAAGDLVVSLRDLHAIVAIDGTTHQATWSLRGPWLAQHDPDLLPSGRISLFDNLGGDQACGRSRILELDPATQAIAWQYDGCRSGDRFDSQAWGDHERLPNGNLLISEAYNGRLIEVTRDGDQPRVVWEYVNFLGERDGSLYRGLIGEARRYPREALPFLEATIAGS